MTTFDYWVFGIFGAMAMLAIFYKVPPEDEYDRINTQDIGWGA